MPYKDGLRPGWVNKFIKQLRESLQAKRIYKYQIAMGRRTI